MLQKFRTPTAGMATQVWKNWRLVCRRLDTPAVGVLPMRHTIGYLVTMLFNIVSDFPGNDVKCNRNIW